MMLASMGVDARKVLFMGMEKAPAASLPLFKKKCALLVKPRMSPADMSKIELRISVFGVVGTRWQDDSNFMHVSIMNIK